VSAIVTYTAVLPVDRAAVDRFSGELAAHRRAIGTRNGTRRLTPWAQAVLVLRWMIDGERVKQLRIDNALPSSTTYDYLHEGLDVLAASAPDLGEAIEATRAAGDEHIGLDGTLIPTCRVSLEGPTEGADLFYSGKHHRHGVNLQVVSASDGYPLWIGDARPGREHDSTAAHHTGVEEAIALINIGVPTDAHLLVLVDLGYEKFRDFPAVRCGYKKPKNGKLTIDQRQYNKVLGALRALAEKANADLKVRFKCLDKVGLNPWRIGTIARACLALYHFERPRLTERHA